jgi:hypothetical protein
VHVDWVTLRVGVATMLKTASLSRVDVELIRALPVECAVDE